MTSWIRTRPLVAFFALSCLLSWWPAALYAVHLSPVPNAGFGPFLAALIVLGVTEGRAGIGRLLRSMIAWRVRPLAYAAAIGLPLLAGGTAIAATIATGGHATGLAQWTEIPVTLVLILLIPGLGGAWEEPGFRGYALPRLEERFGVLAGPLVLGVLWVAWHLPLFLAGQIAPTDVAVILAASIVIAGVFRLGRSSVLIAMILHATNNAVGGSYASQLFHGPDLARLGWFTAAAWWILAIAVMLIRHRHAGTRPATATSDGHEEAAPSDDGSHLHRGLREPGAARP
jgi:membrane protease YdiL (CAAX protease family)